MPGHFAPPIPVTQAQREFAANPNEDTAIAYVMSAVRTHAEGGITMGEVIGIIDATHVHMPSADDPNAPPATH